MRNTKTHRIVLAALCCVAALVLAAVPATMAPAAPDGAAPGTDTAPAPAAAPALPLKVTGPTIVIPIDDVIGQPMVFIVRRGAAMAAERGASAIVLVMDTPGGEVSTVEQITDMLRNVKLPTYTFVKRRAISGGAILALATDKIYMAPGSTIGDAMPITVSPFGSPQPLPEGYREKALAYVASMVRAIAQEKGYDPKLAEAMVRPDIGYKVGEEVICPPGQLLTLSYQEAEKMVGEGDKKRPLLSSGTVKDLDDMLEKIGRKGNEIIEMKVTWSEVIARTITSPYVRMLLLVIGLGGLYIEMKTPGFGAPGVTGLIALAVFFWGHHVAGLAGIEELALLFFGLVLLVVELLFIPGFGVVGVLGIGLMVMSLLLAMVQHSPGMPRMSIPLGEIGMALANVGAAFTMTTVLAVVLAHYLPRASMFQRIVLSANTGKASGFSATTEAGVPVGTIGVTATPLRPAGTAMFGDKRVTVVSRGDFVDLNAKVMVTEVEGNRIVVEKVA